MEPNEIFTDEINYSVTLNLDCKIESEMDFVGKFTEATVET
jgi:hypothetical protein